MPRRTPEMEAARRKIKALLLLKNIEVREIAEQLGYCTQHISNVLSGVTKSRKIREYICKVLDKEYDELWADYPEAP